MITNLENPLSDSYYALKELVQTDNFPWFRLKGNQHSPDYFSHKLFTRPVGVEEHLFPTIASEYLKSFADLLYSVFDLNAIEVKCIYRMSVNLVMPSTDSHSPLHVDHSFPHRNIIMYLTDAGGDTVVNDEVYSPKEDDIIMFEGKHYHHFPMKDARIVFVATYL